MGTLAVTGVLLLLPRPSTGERWVPSRPDEVLAQVGPTLRRDGGLDASEAAAQARALITRARQRGGDPRLLGQAQAVLSPWWREPAPPAEVRLLRATLKQSLHDFDGALVDLEALAADPRDVQAQLTRATVLTVVGRHAEAEQACVALRAAADDVVAAGCLGPLLALRGRTAEAQALLRAALSKQPKGAPLRTWLLSVLGEVQGWSGAPEEAVATLRAALVEDDTDTYSRLLLASTLTSLGRPKEAVALFEGRAELNDAELLELVLAARAAQQDTAALEAELAQRVAASRRRGDTVHRREEARYALRVEGDAERAKALAVENLRVQKEPADVRVLLEAALATKDEAAAAPALAWMQATGFPEPRLRALAAAVESLP